jgi:SNF2 family DNA or RNA helicase
MNYSPEPYHRVAIDWLKSHNRAALFLGMSLGKSAITLAAINEMFQSGEITTGALIIAPKWVCTLQWPAELAKWDEFRWMKMVSLRTPEGWQALTERSAQLYVINWDLLPKLCDNGDFPFDVVVFDETTKAKNPTSKRVNALRPFLHKVPRRWGLTGTPTPNSLMELFAQVRLLDDGERLGRSFDRFKRTYFYPTDYMEYNWAPFEGAEERIYAKIADLALTMRTKDYLSIPGTVVEDIPVVLPKEAVEMYDRIVKDLILLMDGKEVVAQTAAALTNKLLQISGGAVYATDDESTVVPVHTVKLETLQRFASTHPEPLLIACNYRHEIDRVTALFGTDAVRFDAMKTTAMQQGLIRDWNAGRIPRLVVNPASMAHGLNMQEGGHTVVWYSLTWSGELYHQLNARLARRGQREVTRVVRLICTGTMDEAVAETLLAKEQGQGALLAALVNFRRLLEANEGLTNVA